MTHYKDEKAEKEIAKMEEIIKSKKFDDTYIRELVGKQKGELSIISKYYEGNIAKGNWSLIEKDEDIENLDKIIDCEKIVYEGASISERKKDAEYEYVFIPSFYAVETLILYYINNQKHAERIYGLENAIIECIDNQFYGGLPFILKYIGGDFKDERINIREIMEMVLDTKSKLEASNEDSNCINSIIDCLNDFFDKNLITRKQNKN